MGILEDNRDRIVQTPPGPLTLFITKNGLGAQRDMNEDYSSGEVKFFFQPPPGFRAVITQFDYALADSGSFNVGDFGNIDGGLTNGMTFFIKRQGVETRFEAFKTNLDVASSSREFKIHEFSGGEKAFTSGVMYGDNSSVQLYGDSGDQFGVIVHDDLTPLLENRLRLIGRLFKY